jgi:hypothetical protein
MIYKNSQLSLLVSNPELPIKLTDPNVNPIESSQWKPLVALLRWWKQQSGYCQRSPAESAGAERLEIEARVSKELYPKRFIG